MYLFAHWDHNEIPKGTPAEIQEAYSTLEKMHWSREMMEYYFKVELKSMDEHCKIQTALRQGLAKGREEGLEEGKEQGLAKGREEGILQGREEGLEWGLAKGRKEARIETAKQMLRDGMSKEMVHKYTHISLEDIEEYAKSI